MRKFAEMIAEERHNCSCLMKGCQDRQTSHLLERIKLMELWEKLRFYEE